MRPVFKARNKIIGINENNEPIFYATFGSLKIVDIDIENPIIPIAIKQRDNVYLILYIVRSSGLGPGQIAVLLNVNPPTIHPLIIAMTACIMK